MVKQYISIYIQKTHMDLLTSIDISYYNNNNNVILTSAKSGFSFFFTYHIFIVFSITC